jgi:hypothetical protein
MTRIYRLLNLIIAFSWTVITGLGAEAPGPAVPDPTLDLLVQKGFITQEEAEKVKAEAAAMRTNMSNLSVPESKWKLNKAFKNVELFGDVRVRYENREALSPIGGKIRLDRGRAAVRLGLRGEAYDDFYYGLRLETSTNPRSTWITFGGSSPGPFGKSNTGVNVGQAYLGWHPGDWLDITVGKFANPFYTTSMVWDGDLNPEGAVERLKYTIGPADFFANLGQFLYQDVNPAHSSPGLASGLSTDGDAVFLLGWQAGLNYHITKEISAKVGATLYNYIGVATTNRATAADLTFIGEGGFLGPGTGSINGTPGPNNQTGLNHLLILEVPFELNLKLNHFDARLFGDVAYNLNGTERAEEAARAYARYLAINNATITGFSPQRDERKAYQVGVAIGSHDGLGLVSGSVAHKNGWELRAYWQHVEQYALDPNLLDSDYFEGRGNLEGFYLAAAYGFSENVIGTVRYGYAERINKLLGTGGNNLDIPQINPIHEYHILQLDLGFRF